MDAYLKLRRIFPTWDKIADAQVEQVAEAIQPGGLGRVKAPRIQGILRSIKALRGDYNLDFLGEIPLSEAKAWLTQLDGVGPKTAACVLLFGLGRPALPVDTHVYRVARRLGLIGPKVTADGSHAMLEERLGPAEVLPFHMCLITHGRQVCKAQRPRCQDCSLEDLCPSSILKRDAG